MESIIQIAQLRLQENLENSILQAYIEKKTNKYAKTAITTDTLLPPLLTNAIKTRHKISFCQKKQSIPSTKE
jgi:hypothetical protein